MTGPAWTREQIEAWVNESLGDAVMRSARETIVREFPEAPDYAALADRLVAFRLLERRDNDPRKARERETQRCRDFREHCATAAPPDGEAER